MGRVDSHLFVDLLELVLDGFVFLISIKLAFGVVGSVKFAIDRTEAEVREDIGGIGCKNLFEQRRGSSGIVLFGVDTSERPIAASGSPGWRCRAC